MVSRDGSLCKSWVVEAYRDWFDISNLDIFIEKTAETEIFDEKQNPPAV